MITESTGLRGDIRIYKNDELVVDKKNLIVSTGRNLIANALNTATSQPITHVGVGSGNTLPALSDITLQTEIGTRQHANRTVTGNVLSINAQFAAGVCSGSWNEAGLFTDLSAGTMFSRTTFGTQTKGPSDVFTIYWDITIS